MFWDRRYSKESTTFEWYQRFDGLEHILLPFLTEDHQVLVVGCGNSQLSEDMYAKSRAKIITSIDISSVVIQMMNDRAKRLFKNKSTGLKYFTMDIKKMTFKDATFDLVIDKGTIDALMCASRGEAEAEAAVGEVARVLRPGGTFVVVSYGTPQMRAKLFSRRQGFNFKIQYLTIPKPHVPSALDTASSSANTSSSVDREEKSRGDSVSSTALQKQQQGDSMAVTTAASKPPAPVPAVASSSASAPTHATASSSSSSSSSASATWWTMGNSYDASAEDNVHHVYVCTKL